MNSAPGQWGTRTSPCSALNARPLAAAGAGENPTTGLISTIALQPTADQSSPDRARAQIGDCTASSNPSSTVRCNRGRFPGAVVGLGRYGADKLGERRDDLSAGDAKASPQEFIE